MCAFSLSASSSGATSSVASTDEVNQRFPENKPLHEIFESHHKKALDTIGKRFEPRALSRFFCQLSVDEKGYYKNRHVVVRAVSFINDTDSCVKNDGGEANVERLERHWDDFLTAYELVRPGMIKKESFILAKQKVRIDPALLLLLCEESGRLVDKERRHVFVTLRVLNVSTSMLFDCPPWEDMRDRAWEELA